MCPREGLAGDSGDTAGAWGGGQGTELLEGVQGSLLWL